MNRFVMLPWKKKLALMAGVAVIVLFIFSLPSRLFDRPTSFVIEDAKGILLSAAIASDGQWRFPYNEHVPEKFIKCITTFEDKRFFYHPGVDPLAFGRAIKQNITRRKIISGGSTLTMQVIRLSRGERRTVWQKIIECVLAIRLECSYSKSSILALYAGNAPFGSNVVGLEAAAWRYYGRSPEKLSWGEMAALAVLPNAPSLVHPGKNRQALLKKRNLLLDKMANERLIDPTTCSLAKAEPLPGQPLPLPQWAPHLLDRFKREYKTEDHVKNNYNTRIVSTLQWSLQQHVTQLLNRYYNSFKGNGINNAAAIVVEVETGHVLSYAGNIYQPADAEMESHVDMLASLRSPGSTLKPLLFAAMQSDGLILPKQLVPDLPTQIGGYTPQNFNLEYDGAVPANRALSRSLNIPAVRMLQQYKYQRFYNVLHQCGISTINRAADHYGLSLILGGCEVTPWEMAGVYSSMARTYNHQRLHHGVMQSSDWHMPVYNLQADVTRSNSNQRSSKEVNPAEQASPNTLPTNASLPFDFPSLWHTFNAMQEVMRPGEEGLWNLFNSAQRIAWKTGTSFGFRDGWAIGITPKYCVVVWVGNADGEGRPELTGINTAAPILFDIFRVLPPSAWFQPPAYGFNYLPVCHQSGFRAAPQCTETDTVLVSSKAVQAPLCPYHRLIHLDQTATYRVTEGCVPPSDMLHQSWFVLPPGMEFYYSSHHPEYKRLPPFKPGCTSDESKQMEIIYPEINARMYVPREISGQRGRTVFSAAHRNPKATLFWHLDNVFLGTTVQFHQMAVNPPPGFHKLTVVDNYGETIVRNFEIMKTDK